MNIMIAGDFCPQYRVAKGFNKSDYKSVLGDVKENITNADYSIVNFECPVTIGGEKPIVKCGPNLQCSDKGIEAIKWAGFNCITLANNHFLDYGGKGVENTLSICRKHGIDTVGGGFNRHEASKILYKAIRGEMLAVINCCEHEFSIATETTAGSNPLEPIQLYYAIKEARKNADYVLLIVHGGHEHYQLPSPRMQETYRFFIDAGADAVVNHHQHCYSGYELYHDRPIFYGLGNFCFDEDGQRDKNWNYGYMVELTFAQENSQTATKFTLHPYEQCNHEPIVKLLDERKKQDFSNKLQKMNYIISSVALLKQHYETWMNKDKHEWLVSLSPITNRYLRSLMYRRYWPLYLPKKFLLPLFNKIACEAHRDKLTYVLTKQIRTYE